MSRALFVAAVVLSISAAASGQEVAASSLISEARQLINAGKPQAAIEKLNAIGESGRIDVAHLLGIAYYHADDYARAIEHLSAVVEQLPEGSMERKEAVQVLGLSRFVTGRFAEAVPLLEETRRWASSNAELGYVLGQAYVQTRQPDRAREVFAATFGVPGS